MTIKKQRLKIEVEKDPSSDKCAYISIGTTEHEWVRIRPICIGHWTLTVSRDGIFDENSETVSMQYKELETALNRIDAEYDNVSEREGMLYIVQPLIYGLSQLGTIHVITIQQFLEKVFQSVSAHMNKFSVATRYKQ